ncbi:tryptophan synthase subunit alpha [Streptomyces tropicalis]|uniref:Tryptophan synthase alpha chain n=1 Tax=Streptomyces tropicalis TaxID=3034234 RepID=A0ABT6AFD9_9ACTN|nr:tryptophan synthase subunit alpha [Streptomyces tropicalis]MDF3303198.1 tryptophan synthase subunit alpha [Streptomyces tropicalis]
MNATRRGTRQPPAGPVPNAHARFDQVLAQARASNRAALATYLPAGYPTQAQSLRILHRLAEVTDVIELGWPYSEPSLDGPVIQRAAAQSLAAGFRVRHLLESIHFLAASPASVLVMAYYPPLFKYGLDRAAHDLAQAGAAGVILPDLPIEEADGWLTAARSAGLHTVFVVAPSTTDARLTRICSAAGGMLYAPAVPGVTGSTGPLHDALPTFVKRLRAASDLPIGVGIGISTPAQAQEVSRIADVTIVGSALIRTMEATHGPRQQADAVASLARTLTAGLHRPDTPQAAA